MLLCNLLNDPMAKCVKDLISGISFVSFVAYYVQFTYIHFSSVAVATRTPWTYSTVFMTSLYISIKISQFTKTCHRNMSYILLQPK